MNQRHIHFGSVGLLLALLCGTPSLPAAAAPTVAAQVDLVQRTLMRRTSRRYLVCGHRGSYFHKPHNSPSSTERAIRDGADLIELDIETTADFQCVLAHDTWPRKKTLAQWRAARKRLQTLSAALRQVGTRAVIVLDLKTPHVQHVVKVVNAAGAQGRVIYYPGSGVAYHALRKVAPTAYVMARARCEADVRSFLASGDRNIVIIHGDYDWMHGNVVAQIRRTGRRTFVNSYKMDTLEERLGATANATRVFRRGIGIAQTNDVRGAVAARRRMASRR